MNSSRRSLVARRVASAVVLVGVACGPAACVGGGAAAEATPSSPPPAAPVAPAGVPPELVPFLGRHRGLLRMGAGAGESTVAMGLDVAVVPGEPGQLTWTMRYGDGERAQVRDYRLRFDAASPGRCRIDERNGIVLDAQLVFGELVSVFTVPEQVLIVRYRPVPGGIDFALEAWNPAAAVATGGGVMTQGAVSSQRAALRTVD